MTKNALNVGSVEHYDDAELYDHEYKRRRKDAKFYLALAKRLAPNKTLEICCGSGRVTRGLARAGFHIDGFDASASMLKRAQLRIEQAGKKASANTTLWLDDMRSFETKEKYSYIFSAFNSLEHLYNREELSSFLNRVSTSLAPGGTFAFDVQLPHLQWLCRDEEKRWARTKFKHPKTGQRLEYTTNHHYDAIHQICFINIYYKPLEKGPLKTEKHIRLAQRKYFPAELTSLLHFHGFAIASQFGDFEEKPLSEESENQVYVCKNTM